MDRLRLSKQLTTVIAASTTNTTAKEPATNIYHGVMLDVISATKEKEVYNY